jgi:ribosomal protein S12 methylthiotransferase accessory factor
VEAVFHECGRRANLTKLESQLLSERVGVIKSIELYPKDASEPILPFVFAAQLSNFRFQATDAKIDFGCSGKGMSVDAARASAIGEAVERYSGGQWDVKSIVHARRSELNGPSIDPREMVLYTANQYRSIPYQPYSDDTEMGWVRLRSLMDRQHYYAPAVGLLLGYQVTSEAENICPVTSNGLAAGGSLGNAILNAALEVIERDAFCMTWLNRLPSERFEPTTHPDPEIRSLVEAYRRRGVEYAVFRLATDTPCSVFVAFGLQVDGQFGPAAVAGLGADLDPIVAARKAMLEVAQVRPSLRRKLRTTEVCERLTILEADPTKVESLEDHDLLYASPKALPALDFLLKQPVAVSEWPKAPTAEMKTLRYLVDHLGSMKSNLMYLDLTPADMQSLGLHTVKALIPTFQPIDFGWSERQLGLLKQRNTPETVNPDPHPIA